MEENDEQRRELIHKFYQIYRPIQKSCGLREHSHFDIYGNNLIEIWEYKGERKGRCICKVKEDTEMLENYSGKETVKHEKRAG